MLEFVESADTPAPLAVVPTTKGAAPTDRPFPAEDVDALASVGLNGFAAAVSAGLGAAGPAAAAAPPPGINTDAAVEGLNTGADAAGVNAGAVSEGTKSLDFALSTGRELGSCCGAANAADASIELPLPAVAGLPTRLTSCENAQSLS
jgi:hypothetical protein